MAEKLLTPKEAAERLGITRAALYLAIKDGRISSVNVLDRIGLREKDVEAFKVRPYRGERPKKPVDDTPKKPRGRPRKDTQEAAG